MKDIYNDLTLSESFVCGGITLILLSVGGWVTATIGMFIGMPIIEYFRMFFEGSFVLGSGILFIGVVAELIKKLRKKEEQK
jgi:hypothetical protein